MISRTWIGNQDGNNFASNPDNWTPQGAPQPGDSLSAFRTTFTMDISGHDLQGDALLVDGSTGTLNLNHNAVVSLSSLTHTGVPGSNTSVNIDGNGTLNASIGLGGGAFSPSSLSVNLLGDQNSHLFGSFNMTLGTLGITGEEQSKYVNDSANVLAGVQAEIDTAVVGSGSFAVSALVSGFGTGAPGKAEFASFVSEEQTINVAGSFAGGPNVIGSVVTVDKPTQFHATVDLHNFGSADLIGLANADSWSYAKDILSIFDAKGKTIDQLHVISDATAQGPVHGLSLFGSNGGDVLVVPGGDFHGSLV